MRECDNSKIATSYCVYVFL